MSDPDTHTKFQYQELTKITDALNVLRRAGFGPGTDAFNALYSARALVLSKLGLIQPRTTTLIRLLAGLSPGELRIFLDAERGWLVEAIPEPGAQPVRRYVTDEVAETILKGELTHRAFMDLLEPAEDFIA